MQRRLVFAFCLLPFVCCLLLFHVSPCAAQPPADDARAIFSEIDQTQSELTRLCGFKLRKKIVYDLITKEKVNEFLKKKVKEVASPEELRAEELTLKKFGLVPPDFDLAKTTVDVLTEQAAAFYDYKAKKLFITDWTPSAAREMALAHELAHALADQNFNLDRFIKQARKSDDASLARMAVMEGQASWLMSEVLARRMGQSLLKSPELLEAMSRASETGAGQFPVFENAPLYIRETLIFPYTKGMVFQQAVIERLGKEGFGEVFRRPPVSTQQILHPEKYFSGMTPAVPVLPTLASLHGYKRLIEGSMGELDHAILLRQFAGEDEAASLAPHWLGGRYGLLEERPEKRVVLQYASEWDSPGAAQRFFQFYRRALAKKWKKMEVRRETAALVSGAGDDGDFLLQLDGTVVTSLEGLDPLLR